MKIIKFILALLVLSYSLQSQAKCYYSSSDQSVSAYTVTVPTLTVQRDMIAGTILWDSGYLTAPNSTSITCDAVGTIWRGFDDSSLVAVNVLDNQGIYQTNNPGVAIRIWWLSYNNNFPGAQTPSNARVFLSPKVAEATKTCSECSYVNMSGMFDVQLIATGQPITDDALQLGRFSAARTYDTVDQIRIKFTDAAVVVNSASCVLNSKNITVNLGQSIDAYRIAHPGDTTEPVGFNIDLTCDADTNVNVLFSGGTATGDPTALTLNNLDDTTSAQGVGVQILYSGQPITFGELLSTVKSHEGEVTLPFEARVIRLNEALKAGEINATATFDMIYR